MCVGGGGGGEGGGGNKSCQRGSYKLQSVELASFRLHMRKEGGDHRQDVR